MRHKLELEAKHELDLSWQTSTRVWRSGVVVIIVEIVSGIDQAKAAGRLQYPVVGYRVSLTIQSLDVVESQVVEIWIAKLNVVEDVEYLHTEFHGYAFCELGFLGKS